MLCAIIVIGLGFIPWRIYTEIRENMDRQRSNLQLMDQMERFAEEMRPKTDLAFMRHERWQREMAASRNS